MFTRHAFARRLAGLLVALAVLSGLSACSRKDKVLNPEGGSTVTWTNTVRHLIADRSDGTRPTGCTSCHHADTGIPDWSDYATVRDDSTSIRLRLQGENDTMRGFLKPGEDTIITTWLAAGAPQ